MHRDLSRGASGSGGARQATVRAANLALVLRQVFGSAASLSRADIAAITGMTRSTVSRLVDDLVAGGFLAELSPVAVQGPGRPAVPLTPNGSAFGALGLEVNGGHLAVRLLDLRGAVVGEALSFGDYQNSEPEDVLDQLREKTTAVLEGRPDGMRIVAARLALPGLVDVERGRLLRAPNLGWPEMDLGSALEDVLPDGAELRIGNEADLAAWTVALAAPGRPGPYPSFLYVSGEVGIGAAAVVAGRVVAGENGWAGEIGHLLVDPQGPVCSCGNRGCLERYAGRRAMLRAAGLDPASPVSVLYEAVDARDPAAVAAVAEAGRALGVVLAGAVNLLDLPTVVLGGELAPLVEHLRGMLEPELNTRVLAARWLAPQVQAGPTDVAPSATGAALAGLEAVIADPAAWLPEF